MQPEFRKRGFALNQQEPRTTKYGRNEPGGSVTHWEPKNEFIETDFTAYLLVSMGFWGQARVPLVWAWATLSLL